MLELAPDFIDSAMREGGHKFRFWTCCLFLCWMNMQILLCILRKDNNMTYCTEVLFQIIDPFVCFRIHDIKGQIYVFIGLCATQ
ncbi:hypothetical protein D3C74_439950 [compost metagenome]